MWLLLFADTLGYARPCNHCRYDIQRILQKPAAAKQQMEEAMQRMLEKRHAMDDALYGAAQ